MTEEKGTQAQAGTKELKGVGGWLLFFVVITFLNVLLNLGMLLGRGRAMVGGLLVFNPFQLVTLAAFALAAGIALLTVRNRNAVLMAQVYLAYYLVSNVLVALFGLKAPSGYYIVDREGLIVRSIFQAVVINLIWQSYFVRSRRVKATYPRGAEALLAPLPGGKGLAANFDRRAFGINWLVGAGFFLAMLLSSLFYFLYASLVESGPALSLPASYFLFYRAPVILLYSILLVALLHTLRDDWLIAAAMGLGTLALGVLSRIAFSGTVFGSLKIGVSFEWPVLANSFLWSFALLLGMALALRAWGLRLWALVVGACLAGVATDLLSQAFDVLTRDNFRITFTYLPLNLVDNTVTASIFFLAIVLHRRIHGDGILIS